MRKSLGNNLVQRCLVGMPQFLSSTNFLFQIFNAVNPSGTIPISKALCFTVYSLPLISRTGILVGWTGGLSLINTNGSIPALKTLLGKVFPQTLPCTARKAWSPNYGCWTNITVINSRLEVIEFLVFYGKIAPETVSEGVKFITAFLEAYVP